MTDLGTAIVNGKASNAALLELRKELLTRSLNRRLDNTLEIERVMAHAEAELESLRNAARDTWG